MKPSGRVPWLVVEPKVLQKESQPRVDLKSNSDFQEGNPIQLPKIIKKIKNLWCQSQNCFTRIVWNFAVWFVRFCYKCNPLGEADTVYTWKKCRKSDGFSTNLLTFINMLLLVTIWAAKGKVLWSTAHQLTANLPQMKTLVIVQTMRIRKRFKHWKNAVLISTIGQWILRLKR